MKDQTLAHCLNTIQLILDGMEAINQMMMEVDRPNPEAIGYLMLDCIASIRQECATIEAELDNYCK